MRSTRSIRAAVTGAALLAVVASVAPVGAQSPAAPAASAAPRTFGQAWTSVPCADLGVIKEFDQIADCGYVSVPENRTADTTNTIKLGVVRVRAGNGTNQSAVVEGTGGPGGYGLGEASPNWVTQHAAILDNHDWVFFTQRGTQGAQPFLDCEGYSLRELNGATKGLSLKDSRAAAQAAFEACVADFTAKGVDLAAYNTVENAADIVDIKDALGYDKIVYFGESYGTQLGQFLLRDHPEALSAIVLDGVVPVAKTSEIAVADIPGSFRRIWAACAADAGCAKAYPDPEGTLAAAAAALDKQPAKISLDLGQNAPTELSVDGNLAMQAMFLNLYTGQSDVLPAQVYQLASGDTSVLEPLLRIFFGNISRARVMHYAINCTDDPATQADLDATVPALYETLYRTNVEDSIEACGALKLPQLPDTSDAVVTSDIPALVLQGGLDPATWTDGGDSVAAGLKNAFNITIPAGGHIQSGSACGIAILGAFLADPTTKPDTSCVSPDVPMASPADLKATNEAKTVAITATGPAVKPAADGDPSQSQGLSHIVAIGVLPAGDVAQALTDRLKALPAVLDDATVKDGPTVAGQPTKRISSSGTFNGQPAGVDLIGFGDDKGVYVIVAVYVDIKGLDSWRAHGLQNLLDSVQITTP